MTGVLNDPQPRTRCQSSFEQAEEESTRHKATEGRDEALAHCRDTYPISMSALSSKRLAMIIERVHTPKTHQDAQPR